LPWPFVLEKNVERALITVEDLWQGSESYGPQAGSGPPSKIIPPSAPVKIAVTEWPAKWYYSL